MATSNSWNLSATASDIITAAMEDIGVLAAGETLSSEDQSTALRTLNYIAKQWQADTSLFPGFSAQVRKTITLFLTKNKSHYLVGPAATDDRATAQYGRTTIDAAEASGQTIISVTATTDATTNPGTTVTMTTSDIIGIEQNDGTIHWSTIASVAAGDTVTIDVATTAAAAVGNYVWWFTSRAQRFVDIESAVLRDENLKDIPLGVIRTVAAYESLSDKTADGDPTAILIEPFYLNTRVTTDVQPSDVTKQIRMVVRYPAEDYDSAANDIAYPQEAFGALEWELAFRSAPKFGVQWSATHQANHTAAVGMVKRLYPEVSDLYFQPGLE